MMNKVYPVEARDSAFLLAVASGVSTVLSGHRYRSFVMMLQGAAMAIYFYYLLHGSVFSLTVPISGVQLSVGAVVSLPLFLLEAASASKIVHATLLLLRKR
ncbi:MAG: hypothetical protein QXX17_01615 [Conexivisphaerales archaeon]